MRALTEIGFWRVLRFAVMAVAMAVFRLAVLPPCRAAFLRLLGARIGRGVVLHDVRFFNCYRRGFGGLRLGDNCFIGDECMIDLADEVILADQVTLAERVTVLTHLNVGYADHPLQEYFPAMSAPVRLEHGCFVGANATLLAGVTVGPRSFIAAGSVVTQDVPAGYLVGGVPAKPLRRIEEKDAQVS
ncbi:MAG: acyltransferase [Armatimonadetes bacterium CG_4_10_14_0_8_um_filter_66_14]|nr:acyltransferase [Armatimonadota bacterium]OIP11869.1 MAG: hypothetical protein AUJ96_01370 [Armatimonadetes bacterium CG2_30_66_41]PIY48305.1 MAG: acyltransferase [Armatimonadetes bacterium CG_4_10_14_3_um_filter_59_10]PIZ46524.1 MAG: acyltransferase [Armatimonadetes bacterium CG_4_10_14_0_8_um_filter_66_14]PJB60774.1 MAG: acyltransferase [Armatimonadetes bacterium CG_4_9_14_3_um_filter_66_14]